MKKIIIVLSIGFLVGWLGRSAQLMAGFSFNVQILSAPKPTGPWQPFTNVVFFAGQGLAPEMYFKAGTISAISYK